jgi:hypothetical protein
MTKTELLTDLKDCGGYIIPEQIEAIIEHLGANFQVVLKYNLKPREIVSITDLLKLSQLKQDGDIREVFMSANTYEELFN